MEKILCQNAISFWSANTGFSTNKSDSEGRRLCWPWSSWENCARDLVIADFGFSGAIFICGEAAHESAKSKRCIIVWVLILDIILKFD